MIKYVLTAMLGLALVAPVGVAQASARPLGVSSHAKVTTVAKKKHHKKKHHKKNHKNHGKKGAKAKKAFLTA